MRKKLRAAGAGARRGKELRRLESADAKFEIPTQRLLASQTRKAKYSRPGDNSGMPWLLLSVRALQKERNSTYDQEAASKCPCAHKTSPTATKTNDLRRGKVVAQPESKKAQKKGVQSHFDRASRIETNQILSPTADHKVEASALYVIKASPDKGVGMFAIDNIRKGTRILAEKPFFSLSERPTISLSDPCAPNNISAAFDRLSTSDQIKYLRLHCPERPGWSRGISIYEANCFEMGTGTCICLDASRINHSCIPNAHYSWNSRIGRETVHAVKDIAEGEEIITSYCSALRTLEERRHELEPYVFVCRCPACQTDTDFGIRSQIRRQQMRILERQIADYRDNPSPTATQSDRDDEAAAIWKLLNLIEKEGLVYENSVAYHDAAECALKRGLKEEALVYASNELRVDLTCVGRDSPAYEETMEFVRAICRPGKDVAEGVF